MMKRNDTYKRFLAMLMAVLMVFTAIPSIAFAEGQSTTIDITDKTIGSLSKYYAKVTAMTVTGADVESFTENETTIDVVLDSDTSADAEVTVAFATELNRFTLSNTTGSGKLSEGKGTITLNMDAKYNGSSSRGKATYTINFTVKEVPTEVPTRLQETDTATTYNGVPVKLDLAPYFLKADNYYLVEGTNMKELDDSTYTFLSQEGGDFNLVFAASNVVGTCQDYVTVTVSVTAIESGIWVGYESSNGSLDYILFSDESGKAIDDVKVSYDSSNHNINVTLPKSYAINGKVKGTFSLTDENNDSVPFITTKTGTSGTSSNKATSNKFTEKTFTLSSGAASFTFYYYNATPSVTSNSYTTFTLNFAVENAEPALAENQSEQTSATITAGESYDVDLTKIFTDADGDSLTYYVSVNGESKVAADAAYSFTTNTAGEQTLVFTAHDGKAESTETYTVKLTVENLATTDQMTVKVPEGLEPTFYVTNGFEEGTDVLGEALTAEKNQTANGFDVYTVKYPQNAEYISIRTKDWGGMAFLTEKEGSKSFTKTIVETTDLGKEPLAATTVIKYGDQTAVAGTAGYLLLANQEFSCTATPADGDYTTKTETVTVLEDADAVTITISMGYKSPKTITVPTGAKAQLFAYNKYYDFTEIPAKAEVDNGNGTTTFYFITTKTSLSYRASMEGKVTEAGYWTKNMTIDFDNGANSPKSNASVADNSVLVNVNSQNHLKLKAGDSFKLKAYRAWEIIKFSYQNEIITPDFNYEVLSGKDVVSLTPEKSKSNGGTGQHSDWMKITGLKEGTAIIEVTYDAIDVTEGSWPGLYQASDADRTGLIVVTVGGEDNSVDFGIEGLASAGSLTYQKSNAKKWDAEFDTLYFTGNVGKLKFNPTAGSKISNVAVSHDKGGSWTTLKQTEAGYVADITAGNNILRVTTEKGTAYQIVRGGKVTAAATEISGSSDGDGLIEAGESIRITLEGLHTPIPKIAGNYNPGYKANLEGDSGVHMVYSYLDNLICGGSVQYTFGAEGNNIEITIPEDFDGKTLSLTDGYIALGVIGLKTFADGGDSHRNIPDEGCATRGNETTFHTRSMLPEITLTIGEEAAPNTAPTVKDDAVTSAEIEFGQNYAVNPELLFADKDGDVLTYQVSVNGTAAEMITAAYQFTPDKAGTYQLVFTADDGEATVSHIITLNVKEEPPVEEEEDQPTGLVFDLPAEEIDGYVVVSFEDNGVRETAATGLKFPVPLGTIIEPTKVPYKNGESVAAVTVRLLKAMGMGYNHSGTVESSFYLSSIKNFVVNNTPYDEMGEFHAGSGSGWMITLNDVFINRGASDFEVKENDVIRWQYSCQLGADIGDNYEQNLIENVESLIDAIGQVTEDSGAAIESARQAYNELSEAQQKAVTNYEKLAGAEKAFAELLATKADKEAAQKVETQIASIGEVSLDKEKAIQDARAAYNQLTATQKLLVGNVEVLEKAENMLQHLKNPTHEEVYQKTGNYIAGLGTPVFGSIGGDWMALGLARSGREVAKGYFDYVVAAIKADINEKGQLHWYKSTENARVILGLTATGYNPEDVEGYNLLTALTDMEYVKKQGINGPIWALIAFDSYGYKIPEGGDVTREALIKTILDNQLKDGGWALSGSISDVDMTGMALQALAPYYETDASVKKAVDEALAYLSQVQNGDGTFAGTDGVNTESMAQVIVALTALGINPETDSRFVKNGLSVVDALCGFALEDGGFKHTAEGKLDGMATEQGYYALVSYMRFLEGKTSLYDMSDMKITTENPPAEQPPVVEPEVNKPGAGAEPEGTPDGDTPDTETPETVVPPTEEPEDQVTDEIPTIENPEDEKDTASPSKKTPNTETKKNKTEKSKKKSVVQKAVTKTDDDTGIFVTGIGKNIRLVVKKVSDTDIAETLKEKLGDKTILNFRDIYLLQEGTDRKHQPEQPVTVHIPLSLLGDYSSYDGIAAVHYTDDGTIEYMNAAVEGEYLVFEAVDFSIYAVVGYDGASPLDGLHEGTESGENPWLPWALAGAGGLGILAVLIGLAFRKRNI